MARRPKNPGARPGVGPGTGPKRSRGAGVKPPTAAGFGAAASTPGHVLGNVLGNVLGDSIGGDGRAAGSALETALAAAERQFLVQEFTPARRALDGVLKHYPKHGEALRLRSKVFSRGLQDFARAKADLDAAIAADPTDAAAHALLAELYFQTGDAETAATTARAALALDDTQADAYALLVKTTDRDAAPSLAERLGALAASGRMAAEPARTIENSLARALEKTGDIDGAFAAFARANALETRPYDPRPTEARVSAMRAQLTPAFFEDRQAHGLRNRRPVFVIGMPRSGSTLLEQVLAAHPKIDGVGETNAMPLIERRLGAALPQGGKGLDHFQRVAQLSKADTKTFAADYLKHIEIHIKKSRAERLIDKGLANFLRVPLLLTLFPQASIIHIFRHPLDTLWSCYKENFKATPFASSFEGLSSFFGLYLDLMAIWEEAQPGRIAHVCYEDFVTEFDRQAPAVVEALGLAWDPACAEFAASDRLVYTASAGQVHQPLNTRSFGAWRRFEAHLTPLIQSLGGFERVEARYEALRAQSLTVAVA